MGHGGMVVVMVPLGIHEYNPFTLSHSQSFMHYMTAHTLHLVLHPPLEDHAVPSRAWDAAINYIMRKEVVGFDKNGNKYFRYFETTRGVTVERREVRLRARTCPRLMAYDGCQFQPHLHVHTRRRLNGAHYT